MRFTDCLAVVFSGALFALVMACGTSAPPPGPPATDDASADAGAADARASTDGTTVPGGPEGGAEAGGAEAGAIEAGAADGGGADGGGIDAGSSDAAGDGSATPAAIVGHRGRWLLDAQGRVLIVHGFNVVNKLAPYTPQGWGFDDDDAAFLQANGFNAVRLGVIWEAVEPEPGTYDVSYVAQIKQTEQILASHGIYTLLDWHQDEYNEMFGGKVSQPGP